MAEYIEREALMQKISADDNPDGFPRATPNDVYVCAIGIVETFPAADVEPVRHARWVSRYAKHWKGKDECGECGFHEKDHRDLTHFRYCPNCGAKMDLEVSE